MKRKLWLTFGLAIAILVGLALPQLKTEQAAGSSQEVTFQFVRIGLNTDEAQQEIQQIVNNIVGISQVEILPETDTLTITFNEEIMKADWIAKSLTASGYPPEKYVKLNNKKR
ncbi:hypothetical protein BEP19_06475 [Ammoniphilus oxalaticus]|uniref:HMA domain-containing protein n=1 Tax=Ammoniphilus oxalaticus TaxID=66863 RepID=A0A419SJC1_9BACL|nr:hypothetical protein [Ammoniphilus oxalaticus]RKD24050.1 hypothetical protein BEP19_06475 [Ammoniphilus oxalaticus]